MWQERRNDRFVGRAATWRDLLKEMVMPDGPDGHVVELHLNKPEPIMTTYLSANSHHRHPQQVPVFGSLRPPPAAQCWSPGVALSMNLSGDWLRDRLDPILRNR